MEIKIEVGNSYSIKSRLNLEGLSNDEIDKLIDAYRSSIELILSRFQFEISDTTTVNRISNEVNTYTDAFNKQVVRDSKIDNILKDGI